MTRLSWSPEQDLSGPLYDLVTAVLAIGEPPH